MLTPNAHRHRAELEKELKTILLPRLPAALGPKAEAIRLAAHFFGPAATLEHALVCDTLCALLDTPAGAMAVLHARRSAAGPEGPGRTSLVLHYLGVELSWAFRRLDPEEIRAAGEMHLELRDSVPRALVSSDFAYLWCDNGRLKAIAPLAEPLLGLWDLARHVFRRADPEYYPGKRGTPEGRRILRALAGVLPATEFLSCYSPEDRSRDIDWAVVLEMPEGEDMVDQVALKEPCDTWDTLRVALESVLHLHGTPFWDRVEAEHKRTVGSLLAQVEYPPQMIHVLIPSSVIAADKEGSYIRHICSLLEQRIGKTRG